MATVEEYKEAVHHKHANDVNEPFLQTNPDRYCMFPVHYGEPGRWGQQGRWGGALITCMGDDPVGPVFGASGCDTGVVPIN